MNLESETEHEKFVTLDQLVALQVVPVPKDTLYRWAGQGIITGYKAGRRWLFRVSEVVQDIERYRYHGRNAVSQKSQALGRRLARGWR